jgi:hypothetical protein
MTFVLRLIKRLVEVALVVFILSLFMKNKNVELQIDYYGLKEPLKVAFWELVTFCVSIGILVAALGDFITQLRWMGERRRLVRTDREHSTVMEKLNAKIVGLESENQRLKRELSEKSSDLTSRREPGPPLPPVPVEPPKAT